MARSSLWVANAVHATVAALIHVSLGLIFPAPFSSYSFYLGLFFAIFAAEIIVNDWWALDSKKRSGREQRRLRRRERKLERELPRYEYKTLGDAGIRLVELQPVDRADPEVIRVQVRTTALSDEVRERYDAVSYCWGDASDRAPVLCDGAVLKVTRSLHDALSRLRLKDRVRVIWVDGICINQDDLEEKNSQVRMMSDIFRKAARVLLYLGEEDNHSEQLKMLVPALLRAKTHVDEGIANGSYPKDYKLSNEQYTQFGFPSRGWAGGGRLDALKMFVARPWFQRAWIIQELAVSRDPLLVCGDWEMPWEELVIAVEFAASRAEGSIMLWESVVKMGAVKRLNATREEFQRNPEKLQVFLGNVLLNHRGCLATDPRDHVYSLLNLASDGDMAKVNYKWSVQKVFEQTARHILSATGSSAEVLQMAGSCFQKHPDMPSWVPDWTHRGPESVSQWYQQQALAVPQKQADIRIEDGDNQLHVSGVVIDQIGLTGKAFPDTYPQGLHKIFKVVQHLYYMVDVYCEWLRLFKGYSVDEYTFTEEPRCEAFEKTLTAGASGGNGSGGGGLLVSALGRSRKYWLKSMATGLAWLWPIGHVVVVAWLITLFVFSRSSRNVAGRHMLMMTRAYKMMQTEQGYLILGPQSAMKGDKIVYVAGCSVPMVLRGLGKAGEYALVGECYVHGMMGKIANDVGECTSMVIV